MMFSTLPRPARALTCRKGFSMYGKSSFTLTPAYGRIYTNKREVLRDYDSGKDFISQPEGSYINRADIAQALALHVKIRYGKHLEKVLVV